MVTDGMIGNRESSTGLILKIDDFRLMVYPLFDTEKTCLYQINLIPA